MHLRTWSVKITDNGSHPSLVSEGSSEMDRLLLVILGEGLNEIELSAAADSKIRSSFPLVSYLNLSSVTGGPLPGKESKRTMSGGFL